MTAATAVDGYAQAIVDVASAEGVLEDVEEELVAFEKQLAKNPDLLQGMSDPGVPASRRQEMIETLLENKVSRHTISLLSFVIGAGRTRNLNDIIDRSLELAADTRNRAVAEVRVAAPLDDARKQRLAEALERVTGKKIELRVTVDENILGGVWAKVGDQVIDGTLRKRLDQARSDLASGA